MNNTKNSLLVALAIAAIGFFVFAQSKPKMSPAPVQPESQMEITPTTSMSGQGSANTNLNSGVVEIEAGSFYYKPNALKLKKGEKVTIKLNSVDMMHDFVIDDLGLKIPVTKSGESATVEFTPTKTGEFEFYCSVGNGYHKKQGQVGKLIVVE
jgi:heme/copper-type cytochrome/quinol oxidase subunit 2